MTSTQAELRIATYSSRIQEIVRQVDAIISGAETKELVPILEKMRRNLRDHAADQVLRLSFVGQYSAGKSTIISALTGRRDIEIDADIATSSASVYDWDGLHLVDTPGLYTEHRDHDAITQDALSKSDILVFCITYMLFDDITAANFRQLAYEHGYAPKMMLVINKMSCEAGEPAALRAAYETSLNTALAPHSVREFPRVFIDAKDYLDGIDDEDGELIDESNFRDLVEALNRVARQRGTLAKLDTPVRIVLSAVDAAEPVAAGADGEDTAYLLVLEKLARTVRSERSAFRAKSQGLLTKLATEIEARGQALADVAGEAQDFPAECEAASKDVEAVCRASAAEFEGLVDEAATRVQEEIARILEGEVVRTLFEGVDQDAEIDVDAPDTGPDLDSARQRMGKLKEVGGAVAGRVAQMAQGPAAAGAQGFLRAGQVAGGQLHQVVYNVGKFFGYKFVPWEAVNIAKNVGNVAKVVGPLLSVAAVALDTYGEKKEIDRERELARARREIRGQFRAMAKRIEAKYLRELRAKAEEPIFDAPEQKIEEARASYESSRAAKSHLASELRGARQGLRGILRDLQLEAASEQDAV